MPNDKLPLLTQIGVPFGVAALLQFAMVLAIGKVPPIGQLIGSVLVAGFVGGAVSEICVEVLHLSSSISGIIGGATGAVPAVFWASVAQTVARQQVNQRLGVEVQQQAKAEPTATPEPAKEGEGSGT